MHTISIDDKYFEALKTFGDADKLVNIALQKFLVEQMVERIHTLRDQVRVWEEEFGEPFDSFLKRTETDEKFARKLDKTHPMWEGELINWKFYHEELQEWLKKLQHTLTI